MYEFKELLEAQRKLDLNIIQTKQLGNEDRTLKKLVAFTTELGELVNELPEAFKFWANKTNNTANALVEYVDGLHFILSLAVDMKISNIRLMNAEVLMYTKVDMLEHILYLHSMPYRITNSSPHKERYIEILLAAYIGLGTLLIGFKWDEVVEAYYKKNRVNLERQEANY